MAARPNRPPRRGCVRGCAGCLFHHPLTVLLTGIALLFWIAQLVRAGIALATARPVPLVPLALTTLLVIVAQLGPRLGTVLWRRRQMRQAEAAVTAPPSRRWWHWRSGARDAIGMEGRADGWQRSARRADPTRLRRHPWAHAGDGTSRDGPADWRTWRDHRDALWTADAAPTIDDGAEPTTVPLIAAAPTLRCSGVVVPRAGSGRGFSRADILRHLDAESGILDIDPFMEDHPDE